MSAGNWAVCPKCLAKAIREHQDQERKEAYGKVPCDEYEKLRDKLAKAPLVEEAIEPTLHEDCELGVRKDGKFHVSYRCKCTNCDLNYAFKYSQQVDIRDK